MKKHRFHLIVVNPDDNVLVIICFEKYGDSVDVVDEACHRLPRIHRGPEADDICDRGHVDLDACTNAVDKAGYADAGESWFRPDTLKSANPRRQIFIVETSSINPEISIRLIEVHPCEALLQVFD